MNLVLVMSEELDGLYADGKLIGAENPIYVSDGFAFLEKKFKMPLTIDSFKCVDAEGAWVDEMIEYPEDLDNVIIESGGRND